MPKLPVLILNIHVAWNGHEYMCVRSQDIIYIYKITMSHTYNIYIYIYNQLTNLRNFKQGFCTFHDE
jgi:hypothetical protein